MANDIHADSILIVDYGSQYTQLIARRVREIGVYCEIHPWDSPELAEMKPKGVMLSGGPESVGHQHSPGIPEAVLAFEVPVLGICYGMQALVDHFGGQVVAGDQGEFGRAQMIRSQHSVLMDGTPDAFTVWMSHGDQVSVLPESMQVIASSGAAPFAVVGHQTKSIWGLQFHPEVTHSEFGDVILQNFVVGICECRQLWRVERIAESLIQSIVDQVGDDRVLLGLSGGVDSSVVAALLHQAIGDRLICIFVDNGLLRLNEAQQVMATFHDHMGVNVIQVDAQALFMERLQGVSDPEQKRKVIGNTFIEVFEQEAARFEGIHWLAQGTIYPDVIESAGNHNGKAKVIKSHHNVGGLPENMSFQLLEPLRELFKDEVRRLGVNMGLSNTLVYRHPFPGPGLGVRILGEITQAYADILRQADAIFIEALREHELYDAVSQAFVVFLPVKSVGVVGDGRRYAYVVSLRAVETTDFMTAKAAPLSHDFLQLVSTRIMNQVAEVARVTYDISSKPPATIEWE